MHIGFVEIIVIVVVALALLKPDKLEDCAASLGKAVKSFSKVAQDVNDEVVEPLKDAIQPVTDAQSEVVETVKESVSLVKGEKTE